MDPNPVDPGIGSIFGGFALVLGLGLVVLLFGIWIVAQFRRGRVNEETDISYPSVPQGAADQRAVAEVHNRERAVGESTVADAPGRREIPQTPNRTERPIDAADRRDENVVERNSDARNPL